MSENHPRVSVGMPLYNGAAFLERALASLLAQSFTDYEVIVSENGSTDDTAEILARTVGDDPRFRIVQQATTLPPMENFEFVLKQARGEFFIFLAYDDWWSNDRLDRLLALFKHDPSTELAVSRTCWVYDTREEMRAPFRHPRGSRLRRVRQMLREAQTGWFYGVWRRASLIDAFRGIAGMSTAWGWDFIVLLPVLLRGRVAGTNDALFYQYLSGLTNDRHKPKTPYDQRRVFREFLGRSSAIFEREYPRRAARIALWPSILRYANDRSWKIKRVVRSYLKDLVRGRLGAQ